MIHLSGWVNAREFCNACATHPCKASAGNCLWSMYLVVRRNAELKNVTVAALTASEY
jgi:hypothetical protein